MGNHMKSNGSETWKCLSCGTEVEMAFVVCPVCGYKTKRMPDERPEAEDSH